MALSPAEFEAAYARWAATLSPSERARVVELQTFARRGRPQPRRGSLALFDVASLTALHEASHAVVACRLRTPIEYVSIRAGQQTVPNGSVKGYGGIMMDVGWGPSDWSRAPRNQAERESLEAHAVSSMASTVANFLLGIAPASHDTAGDTNQIAAAAETLGTRVNSPERGALIQQWHGRASVLLMQDRGDAWLRVATALRDAGRLTGEQVEALVEGTTA